LAWQIATHSNVRQAAGSKWLSSRLTAAAPDDHAAPGKGDLVMMNGAMMWGMGIVWILVIVVLVLIAAALLKYLFFSNRK